MPRRVLPTNLLGSKTESSRNSFPHCCHQFDHVPPCWKTWHNTNWKEKDCIHFKRSITGPKWLSLVERLRPVIQQEGLYLGAFGYLEQWDKPECDATYRKWGEASLQCYHWNPKRTNVQRPTLRGLSPFPDSHWDSTSSSSSAHYFKIVFTGKVSRILRLIIREHRPYIFNNHPWNTIKNQNFSPRTPFKRSQYQKVDE